MKLTTASFVLVIASGCALEVDDSVAPVFTEGVTSVLPVAPSPTHLDAAPHINSPLSHGDGEPPVQTSLPSPTAPSLSGTTPTEVAVRVAFASFTDPEWALTVVADLDPGYASTLGPPRSTLEPGSATVPDLVLVAVEPDTTNPDSFYVSFDEIDPAEIIRHVTIVELDNAGAERPVVVAVTPVS